MKAIVRGEEELGEQRRCSTCGAWWPDAPEFFIRWAHWSSSECRACRKEGARRRQALRSVAVHRCASCPVTIPATRERCYFCSRTVAVAAVAA